jgi:hypothetical protein
MLSENTQFVSREHALAWEVLIGWERLRIPYCLILMTGCLGLLLQGFSMLALVAALVLANCVHCIGPVVTIYLAWLGLPRKPITYFLFAGELSLAFLALLTASIASATAL